MTFNIEIAPSVLTHFKAKKSDQNQLLAEAKGDEYSTFSECASQHGPRKDLDTEMTRLQQLSKSIGQ